MMLIMPMVHAINAFLFVFHLLGSYRCHRRANTESDSEIRKWAGRAGLKPHFPQAWRNSRAADSTSNLLTEGKTLV